MCSHTWTPLHGALQRTQPGTGNGAVGGVVSEEKGKGWHRKGSACRRRESFWRGRWRAGRPRGGGNSSEATQRERDWWRCGRRPSCRRGQGGTGAWRLQIRIWMGGAGVQVRAFRTKAGAALTAADPPPGGRRWTSFGGSVQALLSGSLLAGSEVTRWQAEKRPLPRPAVFVGRAPVAWARWNASVSQ